MRMATRCEGYMSFQSVGWKLLLCDVNDEPDEEAKASDLVFQ
jgi:hypothetical protein